MADNVAITAGSGTTISTEEATTLNGTVVSAQHVQRVMLARRTANNIVVDVTAPNATVTSVSANAASVTLVAANTSRVALVIMNDSTVTLNVKYGTTASATDFTYKLQGGATLRESDYTGRVDGIWDSATGAARITELTP